MKTSTMSLSRLFPLLLTGGLLAAACGDDSDDRASDAAQRDASVLLDAGRDAAGNDIDAASIGLPGGDSGLLDGGEVSLSDSQIAGVLAAANKGEIDQGNLASDKAQAKAIGDYAKLMVSMHTEAQTSLDALLTALTLQAADSAASVMLSGNASTTLQKLKDTPAGTGFDYAYISAQASQHQVVLDTIDQVLVPQADSAELKSALQSTRAMVKAHLDSANTLLSSYTLNPDGGVTVSSTSDAGI